jgi:alpha-ketoglutarate-dependent taurine dioxygenase
MVMNTTNISDDFGTIIRPSEGETLNDLDVEEIKQLCKSRGAVVFIGYRPDISAFERFTNRLCTDWQNYQGGAHEKKVLNPESDGTILSTNFYFGKTQQSAFELALHSEMSYMKNRPAIVFFYVVRPAKTAGETMLCDGAAVYRELSPRTRELLTNKRIMYVRRTKPQGRMVRFWTENEDEARAFAAKNDMNFYVEEGTDVWITEYKVHALRKSQWGLDVFSNSVLPVLSQEEGGSNISIVRMEDGSKIPDDVIADMRGTADRCTKLIRWENPGDFAILDNTRVLHGRKNFDDLDREIAQRLGRSVNW